MGKRDLGREVTGAAAVCSPPRASVIRMVPPSCCSCPHLLPPAQLEVLLLLLLPSNQQRRWVQGPQVHQAEARARKAGGPATAGGLLFRSDQESRKLPAAVRRPVGTTRTPGATSWGPTTRGWSPRRPRPPGGAYLRREARWAALRVAWVVWEVWEVAAVAAAAVAFWEVRTARLRRPLRACSRSSSSSNSHRRRNSSCCKRRCSSRSWGVLAALGLGWGLEQEREQEQGRGREPPWRRCRLVCRRRRRRPQRQRPCRRPWGSCCHHRLGLGCTSAWH